MSATARVHTGSLRARATAPAGPRTSPRANPRPTRRTGPVHVRPALRLVSAPVGTPARPRRVAAPKRRRAPFVVLVVSLLAGTALALLLLNTAIAVNSLDATQQRAANAELAQQVERLEQQVTTARTPAELAAAAAAAGLVPAGAAGHLVIAPDGTSVVRGTPAPATVPGADPAGG
ncbi:hypothetical protein ASG36_01170 [Geodermatophilus sp. Leaf369]|uniref:hypothetical protein n=1 Tax=Geodermatophilus sp. Leaf369 TaxID=1736354 RepID=UPI0006FC462A|nr:hypothetical protein [Geodermatophilus sp. Leaf369]KQS59696.1 hypothetical protein ASG36_01170 [Geodermatophilus sp. Leaf369]